MGLSGFHVGAHPSHATKTGSGEMTQRVAHLTMGYSEPAIFVTSMGRRFIKAPGHCSRSPRPEVAVVVGSASPLFLVGGGALRPTANTANTNTMRAGGLCWPLAPRSQIGRVGRIGRIWELASV